VRHPGPHILWEWEFDAPLLRPMPFIQYFIVAPPHLSWKARRDVQVSTKVASK